MSIVKPDNRHKTFFLSRQTLLQFLLSFVFVFSQISNLQSQTSAGFYFDSTHIQIGDPLGVKLSVKQAEGAIVQFPVFKDTLGSFEIIEARKKDTSKVGNETLFTQQFIVSAYDSGLYSVLPQKIYFTQNGVSDSVYTDVQFVEVTTLPIDTSKPIKPIKPPLDVSWKLSDYLPYIIGALLLLLLAIAAWWLYKKYKNKDTKPAPPLVPKELAHVWAMKELQRLEQEKLWQKEEPKVYYTKLTDIMRLYLEYRFDVFAMESTTDEIQRMIFRDDVPEDVQQKFLDVLKLADLVKFAKMTPLPEEHQRCLTNARDFVKATIPKAENVSNNHKSNQP
jgi:hypothetical protein